MRRGQELPSDGGFRRYLWIEFGIDRYRPTAQAGGRTVAADRPVRVYQYAIPDGDAYFALAVRPDAAGCLTARFARTLSSSTHRPARRERIANGRWKCHVVILRARRAATGFDCSRSTQSRADDGRFCLAAIGRCRKALSGSLGTRSARCDRHRRRICGRHWPRCPPGFPRRLSTSATA